MLPDLSYWIMTMVNVDVFLMRLHAPVPESWAGNLSPGDVERLARLSHTRRRAQFLAGRHLLRQTLHSLYGAAANTWCLDSAPGKPRLVGEDAPAISLSHTRELVGCAVAEVEIGLDLEFCRERDFAALVEMLCGPEELTHFLELPADERNRRFYRMWTRREAIYKLNGGDAEAMPDKLRLHYFQPEPGSLGALAVCTDQPVRLACTRLIDPKSVSYPR